MSRRGLQVPVSIGSDEPRGRGGAAWPGLVLAGVLAGLSFLLSFSALEAVGVASGIDPGLGWAFPLIIDGFILQATWASWQFRAGGLRGAWYPWAAFCVFSVVSMTGNALHAHPVQVGELLLPHAAATAFSTVPALALLIASHMLLLIATARTRAPRTAQTETSVVHPDEPGSRGLAVPVPAARQVDERAPRPHAGTAGSPRSSVLRGAPAEQSRARATSSVLHPKPSAPPRLALVSGGDVLGRTTSVVAPESLAVPRTEDPTATRRSAGLERAGVRAQDSTELARWVTERIEAGKSVTGPDLVAAGLAASTSTARRHLRELRASRPDLFEAKAADR